MKNEKDLAQELDGSKQELSKLNFAKKLDESKQELYKLRKSKSF